jgi:hypothetical protein
MIDSRIFELEEFYPEGHMQALEQRDLIVWELLKRVLDENTSYSGEEVYNILKRSSVDVLLRRSGYGGLIRFGGSPRGQTVLPSVLNNLWWNGYLKKFGEGIYVMSGRPFGVRWVISAERR